jgi:hypothetical protein
VRLPSATRRGLVAFGCLVAALALATQSIVRGTSRPPDRLRGALVAQASPPCFGAAVRDRIRPCRNPSLRRSVVPRPTVAARSRNAPCRSLEERGLLRACYFGVAGAEASRTIALVGDSHASHWRAALDPVAKRRGWQGVSLARTSCPLAKAVRNVPEPQRSQCARWNRQVLRWFDEHPEVDTVFTGQLSGGKGVIPQPGVGRFAARVAGFEAAWRALPATVRRIVVIRDTPKARPPGGVGACVARAMARRRDTGRVCAVARRGAIDPDPAAVAARRTRFRRVDVVDMTDFFCGARRCYPVIGGALVYKDSNHLTRVFVATLGPMLERRLTSLLGVGARRTVPASSSTAG